MTILAALNAQLDGFESTYGIGLGVVPPYSGGVIEFQEGGYLLCGTSYITIPPVFHLIKIDEQGDIIAQNPVGMGPAQLKACIETHDGNFLLIGSLSGPGLADSLYTVVVNSDLELIHSRVHFPPWLTSYRASVIRTSDGNYMYMDTDHWQLDFPWDYSELLLCKLSADLDIIWMETYSNHAGMGHAHAKALAESSDGGFIAAGVTFGMENDVYPFIVRTDSIGEMIWLKNIHDVNSILPRPDTTFLMLGSSLSLVSDSGSIAWSKDEFSGNQLIEDIWSDLVFSNSFWDGTNGGILLTKISTHYELLWEHVFGSGLDIRRSSVINRNSTGYVLSGSVQPYGIYLVEMDMNGISNASPNSNDSPESFELVIYPNPVNNELSLNLITSSSGACKISLFDLSGRNIAELYRGSVFPGTHEYRWDSSKYSSGIYLVRTIINSDHRLQRVTLIK